LFRGGCERIGIHGKFGEDMVSRSAQASGNSAAVGLRSSVVNPLPADGGGCLASVASANARICVAGIGLVHSAIDLNGLWSLVFFGLRRPGAALVEVIVLLAAIAMTAVRFAEFSRLAFWLMTPYGAWVLYASYLNFGLWRLNKGTA
jgi:TspO/MBR family